MTMPTPRLVIFTLGGTLAYLGLAVLGWGGFAAFFSHASLIALAIVLLVLSAAALFSDGNLSPGEREDRSNRWVLAPFGLIGLLLAYVPAYTDRTEFWTIDGESVRWLGVVLFAAGGALRIWPVFVLGRRFSGLVAIQPGHTLVTRGIYGVIRHPSYLGFLVGSLGWVLAPFGLIGLLLAYVPAYTDRIEFWTIDGETVRWLGVVLFAGGGALRIWPVFVLGHRFSGLVAIQPGHMLVTRGVYGVIRHPSYLGFLVGSLGWALAFRSALGVLLTALLIPPLLARIGAEERLLRSQFGAEYDAYRGRTSRLIPGIY